MVQRGFNIFARLVQSGSKWFKVVSTPPGCKKVVQSGSKWFQVDPGVKKSGAKWLDVKKWCKVVQKWFNGRPKIVPKSSKVGPLKSSKVDPKS